MFHRSDNSGYIARNGSQLVLSRSLNWTACLLTLLLLAASAQASGDPPTATDPVVGQVEGAIADARETVKDMLPPGDPGQDPANAVGDAASEAYGQGEEVLRDVQDAADPEALRATLDELVRPVHENLGEAQRQVDELLGADQEEAAEESGPIETQASVAKAWPEISEPMLILGAAALGLGVAMWFAGQSATVGAGAASASALNDGRRFLPYASPMFTRFEKDTVLGHPKREEIYGTIIGTPGVTLQDLCEHSGLSRTAVTHHLRLLEHQHLIVSKRVGRSRHFFENGGRYGRHQKDAYAILHNDRSKDIHAFIQKNPGAIQKDLCAKFGIQASVAHWHVKRLLEANLLEAVRQGRTVSYFPCAEASYA